MPPSRRSSENQETPSASAGSVGAAAGQQVRVILDAAEATAAEIRADAEREAQQLIADAQREFEKARDEAESRAAEVTKASDATATLLQRIEAMGQEVDTLRAGASRLQAELSELRGSLSELEPVAAQPPSEPAVIGVEPEAAVAPAPEPEATVAVEPEPEPEPELEAEAEAEATVAVEPEAAAAKPAAETEDDLEGARLIALNMALNGNSREDIDRYLQENFDLTNRKALLDEVYASVEG